MIQKSTELKLKLNKQCKNISIAPTLNNTFFVLIRTKQNTIHIHHLAEDSTPINIYTYNVQGPFFMPDSSTIIFTKQVQNQFLVLDLQNGKDDTIAYNFLDKNFDVSWFYFADSNLICLREVTKVEEEEKFHFRSKFSYFSKGKIGELLACHQLNNEKRHCVRMKKANNHSLIVGQLHSDSKGQELILINLIKQQGKYKICVRHITYPADGNTSMFSLWSQKIFREYMENQLLCISNGAIDYSRMPIYNIKTGQIRYLDFPRPISEQRVVLFSLAQFICVLKNHHTYRYSTTADSKYIHFISPSLETVYYREPLEEDMNWEVFGCDYDPDVLMLGAIDRLNDRITIKYFKASLPMKDLYMNMLLNINEDFDDDLLQDTLQLMI